MVNRKQLVLFLFVFLFIGLASAKLVHKDVTESIVEVQSLKLVNITSPLTCNEVNRGTMYITQGALGVADTLNICLKSALDLYAYKVVALV